MQPRDAFAALARAVRDPDIQRDTLVMMADDHERALPPPTVAELLPMVDATHRVEWDDYIGRPCAATLVGAVVAFWWGPGFTIPCALRPSDLIRPGRLVEVSP